MFVQYLLPSVWPTRLKFHRLMGLTQGLLYLRLGEDHPVYKAGCLVLFFEFPGGGGGGGEGEMSSHQAAQVLFYK